MPKRKLTKSVVDKLQPGNREVFYWDEALPGFGVRLKTSGQRSYIMQYRERTSGRSKRMTIGQQGPLMTFDQAKRTARMTLADVLRGADPSTDKAPPKSAPTIADLCSDYVGPHAAPRKRPRASRIPACSHSRESRGGRTAAAVPMEMGERTLCPTVRHHEEIMR